MRYGYARVSTSEQDLTIQRESLSKQVVRSSERRKGQVHLLIKEHNYRRY